MGRGARSSGAAQRRDESGSRSCPTSPLPRGCLAPGVSRCLQTPTGVFRDLQGSAGASWARNSWCPRCQRPESRLLNMEAAYTTHQANPIAGCRLPGRVRATCSLGAGPAETRQGRQCRGGTQLSRRHRACSGCKPARWEAGGRGRDRAVGMAPAAAGQRLPRLEGAQPPCHSIACPREVLGRNWALRSTRRPQLPGSRAFFLRRASATALPFWECRKQSCHVLQQSLFWVYVQRKGKQHLKSYLHCQVIASLFTIAQIWKQPQGPSAE